MLLRTLLAAAAVTILLGLNADAHPTHPDDAEEIIDLSFDGGSVRAYAEAIRRRAGSANIIVMPDAQTVQVPAMELKSVLEALIEPTRAETGCLHYELWRNRADATEFTFIEEWASDEALAAHGESDHIQKGRELMRDLLAEPLDLRRYDRIR